MPFPIESVLTPKVTKVNRMDIGFRSERDSGFGQGGGVADVPEAVSYTHLTLPTTEYV